MSKEDIETIWIVCNMHDHGICKNYITINLFL